MLNEMRDNISKLIALYEEEKQKSESLSVKLSSTESELLRCKKQITELNQQIDNLLLMNAFMAANEHDNTQAKESIGKLIHEIDKCIKLLEA